MKWIYFRYWKHNITIHSLILLYIRPSAEELEVWNDKIRSTERELEQTYAEIQEM